VKYSQRLRTTFPLYEDLVFTIRKINPLRLGAIGPEESEEGKENMAPEVRAELNMNQIILAGVVKPKIVQDPEDPRKLYIEGEEEELCYADKLALVEAINEWSGLTPEARMERAKFRSERLGKNTPYIRKHLRTTADRDRETPGR